MCTNQTQLIQPSLHEEIKMLNSLEPSQREALFNPNEDSFSDQ